MNIKINYIKKYNDKAQGNQAFFVDEKFEIKPLAKFFKKNEDKFLNKILKKKNLEKKFISFDLDEKKSESTETKPKTSVTDNDADIKSWNENNINTLLSWISISSFNIACLEMFT